MLKNNNHINFLNRSNIYKSLNYDDIYSQLHRIKPESRIANQQRIDKRWGNYLQHNKHSISRYKN